MKRIIAFILIAAMIFPISSCGKEKADMYCYNCGEGISKSAAFCSFCGSSMEGVGEEKTTTATTETTVTTTATTTATTTTTTTTLPTTTAHKHSYSKKVIAPTCTAKGYTVFTCSCGHSYKDNYVSPRHSYSDYVCTKCSAVDKAHSYEYLVEWLKENGDVGDGMVGVGYTDEGVTYGLTYDEEEDYVFIIMYSKSDDWFFTLDLSDPNKKFKYHYRDGDYIMDGRVDAKTFTKETIVGCDKYVGLSSAKDIVAEMASLVICMGIHFLRLELLMHKIPLTSQDLGFEVYAE